MATLPVGYFRAVGGHLCKDDGTGPYLHNEDGSVSQSLPKKLYTDEDGAYARLRVDAGQTGFFAGREFRLFSEFTLGAGGSKVYRVACTVPMILEIFSVTLVVGEVQVEAVTEGAEGGVFGTPITVFPANGMPDTSGYLTQTLVDTGGTHTGGTIRDLMHAIAGVNNNNSITTLIGSESPVGRAAIPLYLRVTNPGVGSTNGIIKMLWEERP